MKRSTESMVKNVVTLLVAGLIGYGIGYAVMSYRGRLTPEQRAVQQGQQPIE